MAERQIGPKKSRLVFFARFSVVNWRSRSVIKSAFYIEEGASIRQEAFIWKGRQLDDHLR